MKRQSATLDARALRGVLDTGEFEISLLLRHGSVRKAFASASASGANEAADYYATLSTGPGDGLHLTPDVEMNYWQAVALGQRLFADVEASGFVDIDLGDDK